MDIFLPSNETPICPVGQQLSTTNLTLVFYFSPKVYYVLCVISFSHILLTSQPGSSLK